MTQSGRLLPDADCPSEPPALGGGINEAGDPRLSGNNSSGLMSTGKEGRLLTQ
jgi:hypothetical protein